MPAKYLRCEDCGATFDGNAIDHTGTYRPKGYHYGQGAELRKEAAALGWTSNASHDKDWCPECSRASHAK